MRDSALVGGQTRQHDAGWWEGPGRTVGDRHTPPVVRVGDVHFLLLLAFARLCAPQNCIRTATLRVAPCCKSWSNGPGIVHATLY
eukprot:5802598-Prymnesium_polylepis.1